MALLTPEEQIRYHRQIIMPEIGEAGQAKIKKAKVLIAGLGGLGSISAYYLAASGVGALRIVDSDRVETGNLNRQILHHTPDRGKPKTESALTKLQALNPRCAITAIRATIRADNWIKLVGDAHLIVDATDNIAARKVLNQASQSLNIPFIYGGVNGFNGAAATFIPGASACFECLFHDQTDAAQPSGVIGPMAGLTAAIQSLEALKIILEMDGLLTNQLMLIRGTDMTLRKIEAPRNPQCPVCGPRKETGA